MTFDIGDRVTLRASFTDPDGAAVDPSAVTCTVLSPSKETTTPDVAKASTGVYMAAVDPDEAGIWRYAFDGTGAYVAAQEGEFKVRKRRVPRGE